MSPATFIVIMATIAFFACVATAMTTWCFVLMGRNFTLRRKLNTRDRENDALLDVVREQADDLRDQDHIIRTLTGAEHWQHPDVSLTAEDIAPEAFDG